MIDERKIAFDNISKVLAVSRYDIEQRQLINDYGLNIHGEYFFRDVFNFVYSLNLENANFESQNAASIDLIDKNNKIAYQITTTRTKEKIEKTLQALDKPEYHGYKINIFYLLDKANPKETTLDDLNKKYSIDLAECLADYTDLIRHINNLDTAKIIELNKRYFSSIEKYTDEATLDLVFKHILQHRKRQDKTNYNNDDFGSLDANEKLKLNNINDRISAEIKKGLDWASILEKLEEDGTITSLKYFVIDDLYINILLEFLKAKAHKEELENKKLVELQGLAVKHQLDFNGIIGELYGSLESNMEIRDFNSTSISWIIIAYFFEICDVGAKK